MIKSFVGQMMEDLFKEWVLLRHLRRLRRPCRVIDRFQAIDQLLR